MALAAGHGVFSADGNENTIAHLTCEKLRRHRFAFPELNEQRRIADLLDAKLQRNRSSTFTAQREITLLREFRTRLIADVVTGKLDVRAGANRLPDEFDGHTSVENIDAELELDDQSEILDKAEA
jgi:type I restriction enzyme, S subunit